MEGLAAIGSPTIYTPVTGEVIAVNGDVADTPEEVNSEA
ncbi:hypothetical protein [Streptomyces sp. NPDC004533]